MKSIKVIASLLAIFSAGVGSRAQVAPSCQDKRWVGTDWHAGGSSAIVAVPYEILNGVTNYYTETPFSVQTVENYDKGFFGGYECEDYDGYNCVDKTVDVEGTYRTTVISTGALMNSGPLYKKGHTKGVGCGPCPEAV